MPSLTNAHRWSHAVGLRPGQTLTEEATTQIPADQRSRGRPLKCENGAALGSRTPDLRITRILVHGATTGINRIRAAQRLVAAESMACQESSGGHEGGHAVLPERAATP